MRVLCGAPHAPSEQEVGWLWVLLFLTRNVLFCFVSDHQLYYPRRVFKGLSLKKYVKKKNKKKKIDRFKQLRSGAWSVDVALWESFLKAILDTFLLFKHVYSTLVNARVFSPTWLAVSLHKMKVNAVFFIRWSFFGKLCLMQTGLHRHTFVFLKCVWQIS